MSTSTTVGDDRFGRGGWCCSCPFVVADPDPCQIVIGLIRSKARSKAGFAVLPRWDGRAGGSRILAPEVRVRGLDLKSTVGWREGNFQFSSFTARMAGRECV